MSISKNKLQIFVILASLGFIVWWATFQHVVKDQGLGVQWFGGTYGLIALLGSVIGFVTAQKWGGFKTVLGKALMFFSIGLLAQEAGQLILTYYIYGAKIDIPYPSLGDIAYFGSTLSYLTGAYFLSKASGIRFSLKSNRYKLVAVLVPAILLAVSYGLLLHHTKFDFSKPVTAFLNLAYPIGDALYISFALVALLLSSKLLGGLMRSSLLALMIATVLQYVADFTFLYQSNRGTYLAGKYADLLYLIAYFVMAVAMTRFYYTYAKLKVPTDG